MNTFFEDESGATAIEYGDISSVMFALIVTAWGTAFYKIADAFNVLVAAITLT